MKWEKDWPVKIFMTMTVKHTHTPLYKCKTHANSMRLLSVINTTIVSTASCQCCQTQDRQTRQCVLQMQKRTLQGWDVKQSRKRLLRNQIMTSDNTLWHYHVKKLVKNRLKYRHENRVDMTECCAVLSQCAVYDILITCFSLQGWKKRIKITISQVEQKCN